MSKVIIIGGGIVGTTVAYNLASKDVETILIDRNDAGKATNAGAGILSPATSHFEYENWFQFAIKAGDYYQELFRSLEKEQVLDIEYSNCPIVEVAIDNDEFSEYKKIKELIFHRQAQRGYPSKNDLFEMSDKEIVSKFPMIAPALGGIYYNDAARVDGKKLNKALIQAALIRGALIRNESVNRLLLSENKVIGVEISGEKIYADNIVITGGAWTKSFAQQLNVNIPVEPQKGQIIHLKPPPNVNVSNWPIIDAFHGHYLVPWADNHIVIGATRETESGYHTRPTVAGVHEVLFEAMRVVPSLKNFEIIDIRVGLRPLSIDKLPIIGPIPNFDNVFLATGHGPSGLLLGPYTGKLIADMILKRKLEIDIFPFQLSRFDIH